MTATMRATPIALTRVLLVDGNPSDHRLITDLLDTVPSMRFQIDWARNLAEGLEQLAQSDFDICLLELRLPDGDGLELLSSADVLGRMLPIIVVTRLQSAEQDRQALALNAAGFIEKDNLDPTMLERTIRYAVHQRKTATRIAKQPFLDQPTGLISAQLYRERLDQALAFARRRGCETAVLMIDLAFQKQGDGKEKQALVDRVLRAAGQRLAGELRETDSVGRLSEKRLGLLIEGMNGPDYAAAVSRRVMRLLSEPIRIDGQLITLVPSIGVAVYPLEGGESELLMRRAESAMRRAIAEGGESCRFGSKRLDNKAREGLILEKAFRSAFERRELRLRFYPDIALTGGQNGLGSEVTWRHPDRGWLSFGPPLSSTDDTKLIKGIADWALASAAEHLLAWNRESLKLRRLSLALPLHHSSAITLLRHAVQKQIIRRKIDADQIEVDLPAAMICESVTRGGADLRALKETGIRLAADGFGREPFAIRDLQQAAANSIKLAPNLCRNLPSDDKHLALLRAIINLGHNLGLSVTAKGARDQRQFAFLKQLGCDTVQLSTDLPPMNADAARVWLRAVVSSPIAFHPMHSASPETLVPKKPPYRQAPMNSPPPNASD